MKLTVLDYSVYGNPHDPRSDALIEAAARRLGWEARTARAEDVEPTDFVWLRYDLRSRRDLEFVVNLARRPGRVFPSADAILASEDKWETWRVLSRAGIAVPDTALASDRGRLRPPVVIKPRIGWGGMGVSVARDRAELERLELDDEHVVQPFIEHRRTLIAAMAAGREICFLEDVSTDPTTSLRTGVVKAPAGAADLAARALAAAGLAAGTVDLIEASDGIKVLEVNSAPRLEYPDVDLATPMVEAVLRP